ncbi:unnamed protein product, partial [Owenia fusiformis]
ICTFCRCLREVHNFDVTLMIFSGRPNPRWLVNCHEKPDVCDAIIRSPKEVDIRPLLGYNGFLIVTAGDVNESKGFYIVGKESKQIQHIVLGSAPESEVDNELRRYVSNAIDNQ